AGGTGATHGGGGGASATTTASARTSVQATATAQSGVGGTSVGPASAATTASGITGSFTASAGASLVAGSLIQSVATTTTGAVDGTSFGQAQGAISGNSAALVSAGQGVALETGAPSAASSNAVLAANAAIKSKFGVSPVFFAIGEVGGGHSSVGTFSQTTTSSISETVDLTQLASRQDLVVGLYSGAFTGSGVTGVTFDLVADGIDVIHQTFTTAAAAKAFFTNNAIDVGSLVAGQPLGGNTLTLQATLSITSTSAGSAFYGGLIIGDPPRTAVATNAHHGLIQAMAALGAEGMGRISAAWAIEAGVRPMLSAPRLACWA
ncbi:MAG: hypothetical protein ABI306_11575, partial [Caulobacteraceae bacterium]